VLPGSSGQGGIAPGEVNQMIEIGATQAKRVFTIHEEEIALPQLLATHVARRITQDGINDEFFGLYRGSDVALSHHYASAVHLLRLIDIHQIRAEGPPLPGSSMRAAFLDSCRDFSFDAQSVLLAICCPRIFYRARFILRHDFESGQRQDQSSHTNMGLRCRSRHATRTAMIGVWIFRPARIL